MIWVELWQNGQSKNTREQEMWRQNGNNSGEKEKGGELKSAERWTYGLLSKDCPRMEGQTGWEAFSHDEPFNTHCWFGASKRVIWGQAREIKRARKREGEMQDVRNVRSRGNTWPWQLLSNAELVFFGFVFTYKAVAKKSTRWQHNLIVTMALAIIQKWTWKIWSADCGDDFHWAQLLCKCFTLYVWDSVLVLKYWQMQLLRFH